MNSRRFVSGVWTGLMLPLALAASGAAHAGGGAAPAPPQQAAAPENASWSVLRQALTSRDYATRLLATQGLGEIRGVDVTPWLAHMLGDPEHDVRVAAVDALKRVGSVHARDLLKTVRDDAEEALDVRALAAAALLCRSAD